MTLRVPFYDLQGVNARFASDFAAAQARVLESGWVLRGEETRAFEHDFASYVGAPHCVCVANGLDALRLTLEAWVSMGVLRHGDEVVIPANTFIASALAVTQAGLRLRLADVDPGTYNVSATSVARAMSSQTRVVMPVHLFGQLADVTAIKDVCAQRGVLMLEDAAQAHGARAEAKSAGTFGDAGTYSFYPAKNLGALGDAGCVVTSNQDLADRVRVLGNYGAADKYDHRYRGINSRIDEIQAAFLRSKLRLLDVDNERRRSIVNRYRSEISHPRLNLPDAPTAPWTHVWHQFVVTTPLRDELQHYLASEGIGSMIHYPRAIHCQPVYPDLFAHRASVPVADRLQHEVLSLPLSPLMPDDQVSLVIDIINAWPAGSGSSRVSST